MAAGRPRTVCAVLLLLAVLGALSGCASSNLATVTGGIEPCNALGVPGQPEYAGGTVTVLQGSITWRPTTPGAEVQVLPTRVVAREQVSVNSLYVFTLPPGDYVLQAQFPAAADISPTLPGISPTLAVTVHAGERLRADIPNQCI
jgi:hypothetical protein